MTRLPQRRPRAGFTLIELLIVISIVALLMGLTLSGVMAARDAYLRTETQTDIAKMSDSLEVARKAYGNIEYFPSKLILYNDISIHRTYAGVPAADLPVVQRTSKVLGRMFGRTFINNATTVAWDGSGATGRVVLNGPECLVFYLGGMPSSSGGNKCLGFSTDTLDPTKAGGERMGPFFNFRSDRLEVGPSSSPFFRYKDPYGTFYAFWGLMGGTNSYDSGDATNEPPGMTPYVEPNGQFLSPDRYQIISAGRDKKFGTGGTWDPNTGASGDTRDNISNFTRGLMGGKR